MTGIARPARNTNPSSTKARWLPVTAASFPAERVTVVNAGGHQLRNWRIRLSRTFLRILQKVRYPSRPIPILYSDETHYAHQPAAKAANSPKTPMKTTQLLEPVIFARSCHRAPAPPPVSATKKRCLTPTFRVWLFTGLLGCLALSPRLQAASTIQFSAGNYPVAEDAGAVVLTVVRTNDVDTLVTVDYACADGTATNGLKYTAVSGTLTFAAGETNKNIVVPILNEAFVEGTKYFQVTLSNPTGGAVLGPRTGARVVIADNDTGLVFEFSAYSVAEDAGSVLIGVLRGDDGNFPVTVDYTTAAGTATTGQDYTETKGTLAFAAGEKLKLFTVPILNDSLRKPSKTFKITLSNPTGGGVLGSPKTITVTILDNDPGVQFEVSQYWVEENAGALTVKVLRGNDVDLPPFTVDFATTDWSGIAGQDYTETKGTLVFGAGENAKTITVPITYDQQAEADKKFKVTLSNPSAGVVLGANNATTVTILDGTGMASHRFDGIAMLPDQRVQLTLGGGVSKLFKDMFDIYLVDVSTNLVDWTPLVTLPRTNASTNALFYTDPQATNSDRRFYRTSTNHLITSVLPPPGPFPVGVANRLLTDPSRRNRYGVSTNGSFMASIWYPAVAQAGKLPALMESPQLAQDPAWSGSWVSFEHCLRSYALPDVLCANRQAPYPVVLYSHGWGDVREEIAERGPYLASHGYVVVAVDHYDAFGTVFPDGTYLHGEVGTDTTGPGFQDRVRDLRFVLDELVKWNGNDPVFAGRFDLSRIASMGFSWGGQVAAEFCRVDSRCHAAIRLDPGAFSGDLIRFGLQKPFLQINRPDNTDLDLFNKTATNAIWFQISATQHANFCDYYPLDASSREAARTINAYAVWFLNKYLKGSTDPMPALKDYPRVFNFKQK